MTAETSIIIRTLNEAAHLERLIQGINQQKYRDWEIVLVDSGSNDGTVEIAQQHIENIVRIAPEDFTFGRSLNLGCRHAGGKYLVLVSAHTYPQDDDWLGNLVQPFDDRKIGMVYGRQIGRSHLSEERHVAAYFGLTSKILIDEPAGNNANAAIRRELWLDQPYDELLPGLEDIDWARNIQDKGYRVYYAAGAGVYHIHQESLAQIYRRYKRETMAYDQMFGTRADSAIGMVPHYLVSVLRDLVFGLRQKASIGSLLRVPATRLAFYAGIYQGARAIRSAGVPVQEDSSQS